MWAGCCVFEGKLYELTGLHPHHGSAHDHFRRTGAAAGAALTLTPPPLRGPPGGVSGFFGTVVKTNAFCRAPVRQQQEWTLRSAPTPLLLTRASAVFEVVGRFVNVRADVDGGGAWWLLDTVVLADGVVRLVTSLAAGTAVGSLLGLPLLPLYRRWLNAAGRHRAAG